MSTIELKKVLHEYIDKGDDKFIKVFYEMAKAYVEQIHQDKLLSESEDDIKKGRIYNIKQTQQIINSWDKK